MTAPLRFSELIKVQTVSSDRPEEEDERPFRRFAELLSELYPQAHRVMERETVGSRALVYRWEGTDSGMEPILGLAHFDVVPAGDSGGWEHPPFSGVITGDRIHGRGALDDKGMLAAWMEAVEILAASGFQPKRSLYLAFGGDEETSGVRGAGAAAALFAQRNLRFALILDEGGAVVTDQFTSFTNRPIALIGSAEKGYLSLRIKAGGMSGHASSPPRHSAIGCLARALSAIESRPFPKRLTPTAAGMLTAIGKGVPGFKGFLLRHPGLFRPFILAKLGSNPRMAGLVRTTAALTMVRGGERENVMPESVEAVVNIRILPGESVETAKRRVRRIVSGTAGCGISVEAVEGSVFEPVPASPVSGSWWDFLTRLAGQTWPGVISAPYLMTGTTDSRWYRGLSENIYRFIPMEIGTRELGGVHGPGESVSLAAWGRSIDFLEKVIRGE